MFNAEKKSLFIHIPKTAGTTAGKSLKSLGFNKGGTQGKFKKRNPWISVKHYPAKYLKQDTIDNYFIFSFVRNPWDLLVSSYFWWNKPKTGLKNRKIKNKICNMNFREYIQSEYVSYVNEINTEGLGQHFWLINEQSKYIVDFIGKCETIQEDFNKICDKIRIPHRKLPHANKSKHKHYTEYYDDETKQIVAEKYAKDIEYFGYKFGE